jgi:hypothetical protein
MSADEAAVTMAVERLLLICFFYLIHGPGCLAASTKGKIIDTSRENILCQFFRYNNKKNVII